MERKLKKRSIRGSKGLSQLKRANERTCYLCIAPQLIGFFVFSIYPILWSVRFAFFDYDGFNARFTGIDNFIRAFTRDIGFWQSILNTFIIAYGKLIIELPLALLAALVMTNKLIKGKKFFSVCYYLPQVTGVAASCLMFTFLFSSNNGIINGLLQSLGVIKEPIMWFSRKWPAMAVIAIHSIWCGFAPNVLYFMAGVMNISDDVLEAAMIDGASKFQTFIKITVPMLAPIIKVVLMLAMINGMKMMNEVMLLTNGGPGTSTNVVMLHIYKLFFESGGVAEYGYASALGVITSIIIGIVTVIYLKMTKKADEVI